MQDIAAFAPTSRISGIVVEADRPQEDAFQQGCLYAPALRIAGGTDEILRNIIAERVLKLPQDARVDKGIPFKDVPTGPR